MTPIATRNPNKWWMPIVETTHIIMPPILTNQRISMRANSLLLQNNGNCDILMDNGLTLTPGQSYMIGNHDELNTVIFESMIMFLPATATEDPVVQRLEIVEMSSKLTGQGYYIDQPVLNPV